MTPRTLEFKYAIITGCDGLGRAVAEWLLSQGKKIITVGWTESKLQCAAQELGHNTTYYVLDTGNIGTIPTFIK